MSYISDGFFNAFQRLFSGDFELYQIVFLSLFVSGIATIICTLIGIPLGAIIGLKNRRGIDVIKNIVYTFMGLPSVVAGLFVYLVFSRSGPLGTYGLLYTPSAMIIVQVIIGLPILAGISITSVASIPPEIRENAKSLGATNAQATWKIISQARSQLIIAIVTTFSTCVSEVGGVMMVGGNIRYETRVLTTSTMLATAMGDFGFAMALGLILLIISFAINIPLVRIQRKKGIWIK
jgi:tungstate transport system permease protein